MVVQHNLTAMNSNRMLGVTTKTQSKTTEKLSSGYKINRAADDAAGLAISEKMRKQIRGLTQASANAQDGISAVQTAEGALTEVQDMLQRMNELAVKASNGTQSESDRASIQAEIDQLATEIDRVAETTKFNETYLLKGDRNVEKGYSYSYRAVSQNKAAAATMDQDDATKLTAKITFNSGTGTSTPAAAADQNAVAKALRDQGLMITAKQNDKKNGATYSVTLNGSAANIYKINTKNDDGKNTGTGSHMVDGKVSFEAAKTAKFEIVDLQGNKIADIEIAGGIGENIAAESSKVITANKVEAAENKGDVKQFYDADGNAIAENALGSYFSKLSSGGGARTLYSIGAGGTVSEIKTQADLDAVNGTKTLYTALKGTEDTTTALGTIDISNVKNAAAGQVYIYKNTGGKNGWYVADAGGTNATDVKVDVITQHSPTADAKINVGVDTSKVATPGTAKIANGVSIFDKDGNKLSEEELAAALDKDASVVLYNKNPLSVSAAKKQDNTALTVTPVLSGDRVLAKGDWIYTAPNGTTAGKWSHATAGDLTVPEMREAISNYDAVLAGTAAPDTGGSITIAATTAIDTNNKIGVSANVVAADYYTYTPGKTTLSGNDVAPQAGKQLYDAVGNALDGAEAIGGEPRLTMAKAAEEVAANKNLTGALGLNLHVGADATKNNQIDLKIDAMSARGLGINGIRVDGRTDSNALNAIGTIKEALAKVSSQRSALGAVQNRLEHTINNLDNVVENTTSAESAIRDTDMATTMVQFSNNNILAQAGTSMLAQANQSNQSVLSLLQ